jgi:hypothetical protein
MVDQVAVYLTMCGREQTALPTREGLAEYLDINVDTLNEWCKTHEDLSVACKSIDERQKNQLMNDGLYGGKEVNSSMAIFLLKANHNMVETEKKILAGDKDSPIEVSWKGEDRG